MLQQVSKIIFFWYDSTTKTLLETGLPSFDTVCVQMPVLIFTLDDHTVTTPCHYVACMFVLLTVYRAFLSILWLGFIYVYLF